MWHWLPAADRIVLPQSSNPLSRPACALNPVTYLCCTPQTSEKGKATLAMIQSRGSSNGTLSAATAAATAAAEDGSDPRDWADMYEDYLDAELEEDEEIESYYFSSAAGRARVVLGNRRWGEGGYMRAGGERGGEV